MFHSEPNFCSQGAKLASHGGMLGIAESPLLLSWLSGKGRREEKGFLEDWKIQKRALQDKQVQVQLHQSDLHPNSSELTLSSLGNSECTGAGQRGLDVFSWSWGIYTKGGGDRW